MNAPGAEVVKDCFVIANMARNTCVPPMAPLKGLCLFGKVEIQLDMHSWEVLVILLLSWRHPGNLKECKCAVEKVKDMFPSQKICS